MNYLPYSRTLCSSKAMYPARHISYCREWIPNLQRWEKTFPFTTLCGSAHPMLVPLWLITDSSSSRKMVDGAWYLASSNRTCRHIHRFTQTLTRKRRDKVCNKLYVFSYLLHLICRVCWTYPDQFLRVSSPLADDAGGWDVEEGRLTLCSHGLGQQRLTCTCVYVSQMVTRVHVRKIFLSSTNLTKACSTGGLTWGPIEQQALPWRQDASKQLGVL